MTQVKRLNPPPPAAATPPAPASQMKGHITRQIAKYQDT